MMREPKTDPIPAPKKFENINFKNSTIFNTKFFYHTQFIIKNHYPYSQIIQNLDVFIISNTYILKVQSSYNFIFELSNFSFNQNISQMENRP